jgi:hypothetical protein
LSVWRAISSRRNAILEMIKEARIRRSALQILML